MKGGVAKTTTAVHLAAGLARRGQRVLLVDADPQSTVAHLFGVTAPRTIRDVLLGKCEPAAAIVPGVRDHLDLMLAAPSAFGLERRLAGAEQPETVLSRRLEETRGYDTVVLDTSPSMSLLTFNALLYANCLVIPVGMDQMALIGARQTMQGVDEVRGLWPERRIEILAVLPTFVNVFTVASRATLEALDEDPVLGPHVFRHGIRQCLDLTYAAARRQTIWEYAPRSHAAEDFDLFVDHVMRTRAGGRRGAP